jgi:hypothetical protein
MCPSEIGVQYQPDGRLSTFPKKTATFTGKLLIVPHSHITSARKLSNDFSVSNPADLKVLEQLIALAKDIRATRSPEARKWQHEFRPVAVGNAKVRSGVRLDGCLQAHGHGTPTPKRTGKGVDT